MDIEKVAEVMRIVIAHRDKSALYLGFAVPSATESEAAQMVRAAVEVAPRCGSKYALVDAIEHIVTSSEQFRVSKLFASA